MWYLFSPTSIIVAGSGTIPYSTSTLSPTLYLPVAFLNFNRSLETHSLEISPQPSYETKYVSSSSLISRILPSYQLPLDSI